MTTYRYRGPLWAVIFDLAGTVVDYGSCAPAAAFVAVFRRFNVEITTANAREPMGRAKRDHIEAILAMPAIAQRWQDAHGTLPGEAEIDRLYEQFLPMQLACLEDYGQLIPGAIEAAADCRRRGLKIGSSTGYNRQLTDVVLAAAREQGFEPDCTVSADDVDVGRPAPWLCLENARRLDAHPMMAIVKVDDTPVGVEAGRNAGMWSVGVTKSGNLVGLTEDQVGQTAPDELRQKIELAEQAHFAAGAHYVIDSVAELPGLLDELETRLASGEGP